MARASESRSGSAFLRGWVAGHAAFRVLTVAMQLGNLPRAFALLAAVLTVGSFGRDDAFAGRMGALPFVRHGALPAATLRPRLEADKHDSQLQSGRQSAVLRAKVSQTETFWSVWTPRHLNDKKVIWYLPCSFGLQSILRPRHRCGFFERPLTDAGSVDHPPIDPGSIRRTG